jgi:phosphoglycolate phosphatase-like HAD superfamily hydrolase
MKEPDCVLFDLDGTLSDPDEGIVASLVDELRQILLA